MRQYKKRRNEKYCKNSMDRFTMIFYIAYKYVSTQYVVQKYYRAFSGHWFPLCVFPSKLKKQQNKTKQEMKTWNWSGTDRVHGGNAVSSSGENEGSKQKERGKIKKMEDDAACVQLWVVSLGCSRASNASMRTKSQTSFGLNLSEHQGVKDVSHVTSSWLGV